MKTERQYIALNSMPIQMASNIAVSASFHSIIITTTTTTITPMGV